MHTPSHITDQPDPHAELLTFLSQCHLLHCMTVTWARTLQISSYASQELPPYVYEYVTSVRCVVLRGQEVLVIQDPGGYHLQPGGHCENGETFEQTLRREVLEESGWTVKEPRLLGFRHLLASIPNPPYPFPHVLQPVYCAYADKYRPEAREKDGYELGAAFYAFDQLATFSLNGEDRAFLQVARALL